jgi:cytosine/uracil/thiamine/allantoin permease
VLSNGTAPAPASGTFTTATLLTSLIGGGTAAPLLSTYNDGFTSPIDTTKPDTNYATESLPQQLQLNVIDTLFAISTPADSSTAGGVATASVLQNAFSPSSIPEPTQPGWIFLPMAIVVTTSSRNWRRSTR